MYGDNAYAWACKLTTGKTTFFKDSFSRKTRGGYATDAGCVMLRLYFNSKAFIHFHDFELFKYYTCNYAHYAQRCSS